MNTGIGGLPEPPLLPIEETWSGPGCCAVTLFDATQSGLSACAPRLSQVLPLRRFSTVLVASAVVLVLFPSLPVPHNLSPRRPFVCHDFVFTFGISDSGVCVALYSF